MPTKLKLNNLALILICTMQVTHSANQNITTEISEKKKSIGAKSLIDLCARNIANTIQYNHLDFQAEIKKSSKYFSKNETEQLINKYQQVSSMKTTLKKRNLYPNIFKHNIIDALFQMHNEIHYSILHWAIKNNKNDLAEILITADALYEDPTTYSAQSTLLINNQHEPDKSSPLICALVYKNIDIAQLLINHPSIDLNRQSQGKETALMRGALTGYEGIVKQLINHKNIDLNQQDKSGKTALMFAAQRNRKGVIELLINRKNIDLNKQDKDGKTALRFAEGSGYKKIVELLKKKQKATGNN